MSRTAALLLFAALAVGCVSHDGPFAPANPKLPLHEARAQCKAKHGHVSADGSTSVDWDAYDRCMAGLGWVKQMPATQPSAPPMGGGGGY
jgi:hypothetical protein